MVNRTGRVIERNLEVTNAFRSRNGVDLGTKSNNALMLGAGTSSDRESTSTADTNFMEFRFENSAATGDNRGMYLRLYLTGAGAGGGESLRAFTTVEDVAKGTVHGAHISVNFGSSGSVTGQAVAMRGTLHIPNTAVSTGTQAAVQAEIYADGSSSDISGINHALFRGVVGGDATGAATVANFLMLSAPAPASNAFIDTDEGGGAAYAGLAVLIEGVGVKYIPLLDAV